MRIRTIYFIILICSLFSAYDALNNWHYSKNAYAAVPLIKAGTGLNLINNNTIENTGVISLQGKSGEVVLKKGSGIKIDGLKISNSDKGSDQKIFRTIAVNGQSSIVANNNKDVLNFVAGSGITLTTNSSTKTLTITGNQSSDTFSSLNVSGSINFTSLSTGLLYNTSGLVSSLTNGTSGLALVSNGTGSAPSYSTLSASAISNDTLDFAQLDDALELDSNTTINLSGNNFNLTGTGKVGIGLTTPGQKLHIGDGNILIEGGGETALIFKRDVTYTGGASGTSANPIFQMGRIVQAGDGDPEIRFMYSDDSASERSILEFDRKGIVSSVKTGVGSFFEGHIAGDTHPYFRLNSYPNMRLEMGAGGSSDTDIAIARTGTNTLGLITNSSTRLTIDGSGGVGIGTTNPSAQLHTTGTVRFANFGAGSLQTDANGNLSVSSDERLKDIQYGFGESLDKIINLKGVVYKWKEYSGLDTQNNYVGFLAQDVEEVFPDLVGVNPNGYKSLNYSALTVPIIESIKELNKKIENLSPETSKENLKPEEDGNKNIYGIVELPAGSKKAKVKFSKGFSEIPIINLTPHNSLNISYSLKEISKEGFEIELSDKLDEDIKFSWFAAISDDDGFEVEIIEMSDN